MGRFMAISDPDIEMYGAPTDALQKIFFPVNLSR